ncbi:hypothetical protein [Aliivibrio salmonicida]|uniref:hypothetical protein n=1 Tax=Aliivibrio salmonicida TaxID=40269 RepID=UPI003D14D2DC
MSDKSYPFLQRVFIDDTQIDMANIVSLSYIEHADLSGPTIILSIRDEQSIIRDTIGLKKDSMIKLEMGDVSGASNELFEDEFVVLTMPIENDVITVEGFQKDCHALKTPNGKPRFFTNMAPEKILAELLPSLNVVCEVSGAGTYHLNQGKTPSRLIRNMARDFGAACFISRGTVYLIPYSKFNAGEPLLKMGLNSPTSDSSINVKIERYTKLTDEAFLERLVQKNFASWITDKGHVNSGNHKEKQTVLLAYPIIPEQLANQTIHVQPRIDIEVVGNAALKPCTTIDIEIIKLGSGGEIDESIDRLMGIQTITHHTKGSMYNNRIVMGVTCE